MQKNIPTDMKKAKDFAYLLEIRSILVYNIVVCNIYVSITLIIIVY